MPNEQYLIYILARTSYI